MADVSAATRYIKDTPINCSAPAGVLLHMFGNITRRYNIIMYEKVNTFIAG